MTPASLLASWRHSCLTGSCNVVAPDGCRDLIALERPGQAAHWFVSPLADTSHRVESLAGTRFTGYRFHPGVQVSDGELLHLLGDVDPADMPGTLALIDSFTWRDKDTDDALHALASAPRVGRAARSMGIGERSLERLVLRRTGRPPMFWRQLARLRQAAIALCSDGGSLAELAADHGFSDQAHMSREFRRWLGISPAHMRAQASWRHLMAQSGYGDPATGVQISTKNPSRSDT